jgi:hypothetical protein
MTQPDSVIPDPYNPLDWNRYAYVRYNPINYTDPTGHIACWDNNYGSAYFKKENNSYGFKDTGYNNGYQPGDTTKLTEGGWIAHDYYVSANATSGWWNNYKPGSLTPEQFLGIYLLFEASGDRWNHYDRLKDAFGNQLFMTHSATENWGPIPYCSDEICRNGVFNFMAENMKWNEIRLNTGNSWLKDRFGPMNNTNVPATQGTETLDTLWQTAQDIGTSIMVDRAAHKSPKDPKNVPLWWGFLTDVNGVVTAGVWNFDFSINYAPLH